MIYETIVTSVDAQGEPHIAPFGIQEEGGFVVISPFKPSTTLDNLLTTRVAIINLTDDVRVFAGALTGRSLWPLSPAKEIQGFVLESALAHSELELTRVDDNLLRPKLYFRIVYEELHKAFKGFNRAQSAVIELAILVSRLHMLPLHKIETELSYLQIAIDKTAGERELQAWSWLVEKVENHKAASTGENLA